MTTWTHADLAAALAARYGKQPQRQATGSYKTNCPCHQDKIQSLHVSESSTGALVRCMAGCDQSTVWQACLEAMGGGRPAAPTTPPKAAPVVTLPAPEEIDRESIKYNGFPTPAIVYEYRDTDGALHFYNCRFEFDPPHPDHGRKTHRPYSHTDKGWRFMAPEAGRRIPFRLDNLKPTGTVIIHEGEKAANAGAELSPDVSHLGFWGGAGGGIHADWTAIAGRDVWLLPDNDDPGIKGMRSLGEKLTGLGCTVTLCENVGQALASMGVNTELLKGFDAADALELGWDKDRFIEYLDLSVTPVDAVAAALKTFTESVSESRERGTVDRFLPLGYDNDTYFYLSRATRQIHRLTSTSHKRATLISICPEEAYWRGYVPEKKTGPDWDQAAARMMSECHACGVFDPASVRGRGAWWDGDRSVLHLGNRLIVDGVETDIMEFRGEAIYEMRPRIDGPGAEAMTDAECAEYLDIARQFSWDNPVSAIYLMGWIALAPICGALDWRPHIWITGKRGCGKSTIQDDFTGQLLGNIAIQVQGDSTEAGIRQTLKHDALAVIVDESEQDQPERLDAIIQMIRQASSESGAVTIKGGATGQSVSYRIRSMFMLGSVGVALTRSADESRIAVLGLKKSAGDWRGLENRIRQINRDTSKRLIARIARMIPVIRKNVVTYADALRQAHADQRQADQYGTLLAGYTAWLHDRIVTPAEAAQMVADVGGIEESEIEADELQALHHLLAQPVKVDRSSGASLTMTIGELIKTAAGITSESENANVNLARHGVKVSEYRDEIMIATTHPQLAKIYQQTPWRNWPRFLGRVPGVSQSGGRKARFAGGYPVRVITIPTSIIVGEEEAADVPNF